MELRHEKQNHKMTVVIIGPEPQCVRCLNTYKFAQEAAQQFAGETIEVRKISSRSDEAGNYGRVEGGRDIAEREQVKTDGNKFQKLMAEVGELERDGAKNRALIEARLGEIDKTLAPVRQKAEEVGSLMTPVLAINGKVKSSGYVPRKEQIREWIESELKGEQHIHVDE
jgi:hypothetical protein